MNIFFNIGNAIVHAFVSVMLITGLKSTPVVVPDPIPVIPQPTQIEPLSDDDVSALQDTTDKSTVTIPPAITMQQHITINNTQPIARAITQALLPVVTQQINAMTKQDPTPQQTVVQAPDPIVVSLDIQSRGIAPLTGTKLARSEPFDEQNQVDFAVFVTDQNGNYIKSDTMNITATDSTQNKVLNGTGANEQGHYFYSFEYNFTSVGEHTVTFTIDGVTKSMSFDIEDEDTR